ncbi:uncharacterized protein TNCV_1215521 [Trichonephila clavipes]|nr:uncharacterized protein TNCV_1215521 [Trichonephila clavipes]
MTPELTPSLLTTTPHQREDVTALDRFNVHRCPTRRVFSGTGLQIVTRQATVRYLYHSATAAPEYRCNILLRELSLVYADKPQTLDHLEDNIRRVIADIRPQMLGKVIENWTSRLDYIRASRGSPIPEIIFKILEATRSAPYADSITPFTFTRALLKRCGVLLSDMAPITDGCEKTNAGFYLRAGTVESRNPRVQFTKRQLATTNEKKDVCLGSSGVHLSNLIPLNRHFVPVRGSRTFPSIQRRLPRGVAILSLKERGVPPHVSSTSLDHGSKLRGPSPKALVQRNSATLILTHLPKTKPSSVAHHQKLITPVPFWIADTKHRMVEWNVHCDPTPGWEERY